MKIVLFDFCDTLVNFQTANPFVDMVKKECKRGVVFDYVNSIRIIHKFFDRHWMIRKKLNLYQLKGVSKDQIGALAKKYYETMILPNSFTHMKELVKKYKAEGYVVYIVSGGYKEYIDYYVADLGIDGVIANEFRYINRFGKSLFSGLLCRKDCMGIEKVNRLNQMFDKNSIEHSVSYSDSLSDLPLFKWTDNPILVSKYKERKSAAENNLEQIVLANCDDEITSLEFKGATV